MGNSEVPIVVDDNEPNDKDGVNVDDNQKFKKKKTSVVWDNFTTIPKKEGEINYKTSVVWDHFTKIPKKEGEINYKPKASCNYCGQVHATDSNLVGTSSMRTHFQKLCREGRREGNVGKGNHDSGTKKEKGKGRGKSVTYGTPNSDDWKVVELYVEVLRVFFVVTEQFSGSLYVTSNTFFKEVMTIKKAIVTLEKSDDLKLVMLAKGMNKKYEKYWATFDKINQLLLYANVLDPHWKFVFVRWCLSKHCDKMVVDHKILEMKEGMTRLYNWYEMRSIQYAEEHNVGESRNMEKNAKGSFDYCDEMESDFESFMQAETNMVAKSELEGFWSESNESN
ncbi:hypothetical protein Vadar_022805 [Vaccinium darrowii]|uniref:Uncharacterized protein n=1 Tax=Vaccinium darrowii TaxID=229202 RepID=A0ACB7YYL2_9ERIC|nr:hypothetical protein Vadar_022805 [Vaccinium darrowii]